ncbi:MAG: preprotein translocase subunit YajC [Flavobacteriaceae bacterium]|jgi:preprotein translocase subunit YajC|nr:preprotein translocase subunit YajC [Flavobacteriaceae bacterium]
MDTSLLFPLLILVVLYFFMIRPQMNQAKKEKKFNTDIKRGDRIVTKSGIYGTINDVNHKEGTCIIATMAGKIKFDKSAISMDLTSKLKKTSSQ